MFGPGTYTESDALVGFIDSQLAALRAAAYGLSEEQARATPCRSSLSVGGLIKHATYVLRGPQHDEQDRAAKPDQAGIDLFVSSFALTADETLDGALADFDAARETYLARMGSVDPGAEWIAPPAPWDGQYEPIPSVQRYILIHHVEEFARHAGHADIVREQVDGADAASLLMAVEGREGNDFVQPWSPSV